MVIVLNSSKLIYVAIEYNKTTQSQAGFFYVRTEELNSE
jgi:hypothetical protein